MKPDDLLLDLVAIPSVSPMSNAPMIAYAEQYLRGWKKKRYCYRDAAGVEKINLIATTKPGVAELALVCHTDTVPCEAEGLRPMLRGGKLYGRGSCDVKGFLACILSAVSRVDVKALKKPLAVVLTADEEVGCVGAKFLAKKKAFRARHIIIGEPTGLRPVCAGKGYALGEIVVRGKEAHSAYPAHGHSAIVDAARVVLALEGVAKKLKTHKNRAFDPPFTTLNAGLIHGGTAKNIIPGECRITVEWRPVPGHPEDGAAHLIREMLAGLRGIDAAFEVKRLDPPFEPSPSNELATMVQSLANTRPDAVPFGTEAAHLRGLGGEVIVFGAGDMTMAHTDHEFVPVKELRACAGNLVSIIERLCGRTQ
ncbi:MAG TPA: acetylornithine deacetylase [Bryobacteraceae bacterium]|nr:acetylornithine deacetylase [Bryobacteraceae bacterium]